MPGSNLTNEELTRVHELRVPLTEEELALLRRSFIESTTANHITDRITAIQWLELRLYTIRRAIDRAENWSEKETALKEHLRISSRLDKLKEEMTGF